MRRGWTKLGPQWYALRGSGQVWRRCSDTLPWIAHPYEYKRPDRYCPTLNAAMLAVEMTDQEIVERERREILRLTKTQLAERYMNLLGDVLADRVREVAPVTRARRQGGLEKGTER